MDWPALWTALLIVPIGLLWVGCLVDVLFRRRMVGWRKALWVVFILVLPVIGPLTYLILRTPEPDPQTVATTMTEGWAGSLQPASTPQQEGPSLSTELT